MRKSVSEAFWQALFWLFLAGCAGFLAYYSPCMFIPAFTGLIAASFEVIEMILAIQRPTEPINPLDYRSLDGSRDNHTGGNERVK